jgi:hypothetical protein
VPSRGPPEPVPEAEECEQHLMVFDRGAELGQKERVRTGDSTEPMSVTSIDIPSDCLSDAGMQRNQSGPTKFSGDDGDQTPVDIHVTSAQGQGFRDPQARGSQQAEECRVRVRAQAAGRTEPRGGAKQRRDLLIGVDVWWAAPVRRSEQSLWRDLGRGVPGAPDAGLIDGPCPGVGRGRADPLPPAASPSAPPTGW